MLGCSSANVKPVRRRNPPMGYATASQTFRNAATITWMPHPKTLKDLVLQFPQTGKIDAIILRPGRRETALSVSEGRAEPGVGMVGDRRAEKQRDGDAARKRELTLVQAEHLPLIARWCGVDAIDPRQLRRNLVVSGINLLSMKSPFPDLRCEWQVGDSACIVVTGSCDPCSLMETDVGYGAYNGMRGHGGLTALITAAGVIRVGDSVRLKHVHEST